ncbi:MAG: hypothetical protein WCV00_16455 [Verrucomicrobiia bacterium]|jgi:hypothetical protein
MIITALEPYETYCNRADVIGLKTPTHPPTQDHKTHNISIVSKDFEQLVQAHNLKVPGSNPSPATNFKRPVGLVIGGLFAPPADLAYTDWLAVGLRHRL